MERTLKPLKFSAIVFAALAVAAPSRATERLVCKVESAALTSLREGQWHLTSFESDEFEGHYVVNLDEPSVTQVEIIWGWEPEDCSITTSYQTGEAKQLRCVNNGNTLTFSLDIVSLDFFVVALEDDFNPDTNVNEFVGTFVSTGGCVEVSR